MNVGDRPSAVFGQRGRQVHAPATSPARTAKLASPKGHVVWLLGLTCLLLAVAGAIFWTLTGIGKLNTDSVQATQKVIEIVNRPITHLPRSGPVQIFSPGWFHPGAVEPDFSSVDVRATQELLYERYGHVSSDVNPTEMFIGSELEYNGMTKYFYTDRTLPKRRLSDAEMVEINGLYRAIGRDQQALFMRFLLTGALGVVALCLGYGLLMAAGRTLRDRAG